MVNVIVIGLVELVGKIVLFFILVVVSIIVFGGGKVVEIVVDFLELVKNFLEWDRFWKMVEESFR